MKSLPTSWNDITLADYKKVYHIIISDEYESDIEKMIDIVLELSHSNINDAPLGSIKKIEFMLHPELIPNKLPKAFVFRNKIYKPCINFKSLNAGQYIDLTTYTKNPDKIVDNMNYLMAIMCSPVNWIGIRKKYNGVEMAKRAEIFNDLPITLAYPLCVFFCLNLENSIKSMQDYLAEQAVMSVEKLKNM